MLLSKIRDILIPIVTLCIIILISGAIIAYGRGYRFDIFRKSINPTGLVAATSDPTGAQVYVDGKLTTATNNTINTDPGWYTITIAKEGFQNWEKQLRVQGEVVTRADAYLFPANPSLSTLTTFGVIRPTLSPDGSKLAYIVPQNHAATGSANLVDRSGIWVHEVSDRPLGFARDARQIAESAFVNLEDCVLSWSPDSKQIVAAVKNPISGLYSYFLLEVDRLNTSPMRIVNMNTLYAQWQVLSQTRRTEQLSSLKPNVAATVSAMMKILNFSPDENKILYEASASATLPPLISPPLIGTNPTAEIRAVTRGNIYVYDIKEDKNYEIGSGSDLGITARETRFPPDNDLTDEPVWQPLFTSYTPPPPIQWLPTNRHLIIVRNNKIEATEYDRTNATTLYAGPFWDGFVAPWSNASRILILTNLNPAASTVPNLYAVNLR